MKSKHVKDYREIRNDPDLTPSTISSQSTAALGRDQWTKFESFFWLNPLSEIQIHSAIHKTQRKGLNNMPCSLLPS